MALFRENPSDAEKKRSLTPKEIQKYRRLITAGSIGLISVIGVLLGFIFDWIPRKGNLQVWAFCYMVLGFVVYAVVIVAGLSKGRDHRPGVIEMLGAGGRR